MQEKVIDKVVHQMELEHDERQIISIDFCLELRRAALERVQRACCNADAHTNKHSDSDADAQPNANRDARLQERERIGSGLRFFNDGEGGPSCYGDGRGD